MTTFLQFHMLIGYAAVLLNRDDSGRAKNLIYGASDRTRVSSQCLKRHWRMADGPMALSAMDGFAASVRTRNAFSGRLEAALVSRGMSTEDAGKVTNEVNMLVYGDSGNDVKTRQLLLLSEAEIDYAVEYGIANRDSLLCIAGLEGKAKDVARKEAGVHRPKFWSALRDAVGGTGGTIGAMFGRMVTADPAANVDAAMHVAHAFTVHETELEVDYFTAVDDLPQPGATGSGHINETEITSGLFYVNVVVDTGVLMRNIGQHNTEFASEMVRRLVHLIATTPIGAKRGSTAPYSFASLVLAESGTRQPRSLAEAFRDACPPKLAAAQQALTTRIQQLDAMYGQEEQRVIAALEFDGAPINAKNMTLDQVATWAASEAVRTGA